MNRHFAGGAQARGGYPPPPPPPLSAAAAVPPSGIAERFETVITNLCYRNQEENRKKVQTLYGLQVPVWLWTHQAVSDEDSLSKYEVKALELLRWLVVCGVPNSFQQHPNLFPASAATTTSNTEAAAGDYPVKPVAFVVSPRLATVLRRELQLSAAATTTTTSPQRGPRDGAVTPQPPAALPPAISILLPHEVFVFPNGRPSFGLVVSILDVCSGSLAQPQFAATFMRQYERQVAEALALARDAFVLLSDVIFTHSELVLAKVPAWRTAVLKLRREAAFPYSRAAGVTPSGDPAHAFTPLSGPTLPVCCPRHPQQRLLATGRTAIAGFCKRHIFAPMPCGIPTHIAASLCHDVGGPKRGTDDAAAGCGFACDKVLPCGHLCQMSCHQECSCLVHIEEDLPCSHQIVVALDADSMSIYNDVQHRFSGCCSDRAAGLPCAVDVSTQCARCLGLFTAPCSVLTAAGHTLENRVVVCSGCIRMERAVHNAVLGEVALETENIKRERKLAAQRAVLHQRKAASAGLFQLDSRVVITDVAKVIEPLSVDDFPDLAFEDYSVPHFMESLEGAHGVLVAKYTDVDDFQQLRNVVRLGTGKCVIVIDGGLQAVRVIAGGGVAANLPLMLMGPSGTHLDPATATPAPGTAFLAPELLHKLFHLVDSVPLVAPTAAGDADGEVTHCPKSLRIASFTAPAGAPCPDHLHDVLVKVVGPGPAGSIAMALVECEWFDYTRYHAEVTPVVASPPPTDEPPPASADQQLQAEHEERPAKMRRTEKTVPPPAEAQQPGAPPAVPSASSPGKQHDKARFAVRLQFYCPIEKLLPLPATCDIGRDVVVFDLPRRQVLHFAELRAFDACLHHTPCLAETFFARPSAPKPDAFGRRPVLQLGAFAGGGGGSSSSTPSSAAAAAGGGAQDDLLQVVAVINAPIGAHVNSQGRQRRGPCCILTPKKSALAMPVRESAHARHGRSTTGGSGGGRMQRPLALPCIVVPLVFVGPDDAAEAEAVLDADALAEVAKRTADRIADLTEKEALRNDEAIFFRQQQLLPVAPDAPRRTALSVPVALLTVVERARLESSAHARAHADARALTTARSRDLLSSKLELLPATLQKWHAECVAVRQREQDDDVTFIQKFNVVTTSAAVRSTAAGSFQPR